MTANSDGTITERKAIEIESTISDEGKNIDDYTTPVSKATPKNDMPHRNYRAFNQLFPKIVDGTYNYMRFESDGFEPLSVEHIGGNQISIMHTFIALVEFKEDF